MGRPSLYTPELVATIAERLATGEPLAAICRDAGMPHPSTVRDWMAAHEDVSRVIARAREDGFDAIAAGVRQIARGTGESTSDVQRDKLIIDTDIKLLAKWDPKRYGERMTLAGDSANPLLGMSDEQVDARFAALMAKVQQPPPEDAT
jgi:hypothetical protein